MYLYDRNAAAHINIVIQECSHITDAFGHNSDNETLGCSQARKHIASMLYKLVQVSIRAALGVLLLEEDLHGQQGHSFTGHLTPQELC